MKQFILSTLNKAPDTDPEKKHLAAITFFATALIFGLLAALVAIPFVFAGIFFFCFFSTNSLFGAFGIAWDNTLFYSMITGAASGTGYFLILYLGNLFYGDELIKRKDAFEDFKEKMGFRNTEEYQGENFIIMTNSELSEALIVWNDRLSDKFDHTILTTENVLESSVYIDEMTVSKVTSGTASSLTGAAIGGILTGGTGAIVGAIAGKRSKSESEVRVRKIGISLTMKNSSRPHVNLIFRKPYNKQDNGLKKGDWLLERQIDRVNHWQAVIKNIMSSTSSTT